MHAVLLFSNKLKGIVIHIFHNSSLHKSILSPHTVPKSPATSPSQFPISVSFTRETTMLCLDFFLLTVVRKCLHVESWKDQSAHLTHFHSLRGQNPALTFDQCLKTVASYILSSFTVIYIGRESSVAVTFGCGKVRIAKNEATRPLAKVLNLSDTQHKTTLGPVRKRTAYRNL